MPQELGSENEQALSGHVASTERLGPAPRWWHCDTHGPGSWNAWGCPECVRELREELRKAHRALTLALQQHERSHAEVLRLAERLRKYEPGSPMVNADAVITDRA